MLLPPPPDHADEVDVAGIAGGEVAFFFRRPLDLPGLHGAAPLLPLGLHPLDAQACLILGRRRGGGAACGGGVSAAGGRPFRWCHGGEK